MKKVMFGIMYAGMVIGDVGIVTLTANIITISLYIIFGGAVGYIYAYCKNLVQQQPA